MNYTLTVTGAAFVILTILAVLASRGRSPSTAAVGPWLFGAAGFVVLVAVLYLVQRAYPGQPGVYTTLRVMLAVALVGTMARIILLLR